jgi:hypothetical protein
VRLYLSSFRMGDHPEHLLALVGGDHRRSLVIANAMDDAPPDVRRASVEQELAAVTGASRDGRYRTGRDPVSRRRDRLPHSARRGGPARQRPRNHDRIAGPIRTSRLAFMATSPPSRSYLRHERAFSVRGFLCIDIQTRAAACWPLRSAELPEIAKPPGDGPHRGRAALSVHLTDHTRSPGIGPSWRTRRFSGPILSGWGSR